MARTGQSVALAGLLGTYFKYFKPGDIVVRSGIYDVVHCFPHSVADHHQVTCVKGEPFPPCRDCKGSVKYKLNRAAEHLSDHPHLGNAPRADVLDQLLRR